jgi:uncharacterized membrane protein
VKILLLVSLFLFTTFVLNASEILDNNGTANFENNNSTLEDTPKQEKVIYLSYERIPSRVLKGEIFPVTIKTLSTAKDFTDITYELSGAQGLKLLSEFPSREIEEKYYYETFYFLTTSNNARLPDFEATIINYNDTQYKKTTLAGKELNVVALNPKSNFANIVADSFEVIEYKTTSYDRTHNIVVFVATATNCDIASLKLNNIFKQGIESVSESYFDSKIIYYAVIDKKLEELSFSYFNLKKNQFLLVHIPIIVNDDSVTTQSDLKPIDQSREILKMTIAGAVAFIGFIIILFRKKYIYLVFILLPLVYIIYISAPSKEICIKQGSKIHLLPVNNGTIFETTTSEYHLQKEGEAKGFVKVQLKNEQIGWVKDEDICSN